MKRDARDGARTVVEVLDVELDIIGDGKRNRIQRAQGRIELRQR